MRCTLIFRGRVATFLLKNMSFLAELQPEIDLCIGIQTSCNIPGGSPTLNALRFDDIISSFPYSYGCSQDSGQFFKLIYGVMSHP